MATTLTHVTSVDQVRDEGQLIRQEYRGLRGCRGSVYDLLSRAATVAAATIENRAVASTNLKLVSTKRERFASEMEAVLCGPGSPKIPKRVKRHAAVVSYLVTMKGISPPELPTELRKGIGALAREAAEAMRNRRKRRRVRVALDEQLRLDIPGEDVWRMAAKPTGYRVAIVLSRSDNDEAPYELECVRFLGRRL